jgi:hypothetical protein
MRLECAEIFEKKYNRKKKIKRKIQSRVIGEDKLI